MIWKIKYIALRILKGILNAQTRFEHLGILGGDDPVTKLGRFVLLDKVTGEPIAKPARWVGFYVFFNKNGKEGSISKPIRFMAWLRHVAEDHSAREERNVPSWRIK